MPRSTPQASPDRKRRRRRPAPPVQQAGMEATATVNEEEGGHGVCVHPLPPRPSATPAGLAGSPRGAPSEGSGSEGEGPSFRPAVTGGDGMRSAVPKTISNPLYGTSRREFRRVVAGLRGSGEGIFGIIDNDIARILEAVSSLAETTYDSYGKAAKRIITASTAPVAGRAVPPARGPEAQPGPQGDPSALAHAMAMGSQAREELKNAQNRYRLLDAMCSRQADLFSQLHASAHDAVQVCQGMQWMAPPIAKLAAILGSCRPDAGLQGQRARPAVNDTDYCSPPVFERLVREMSDIESILYDYKEMQGRVLELTRELRAVRRQGVVPGMQPSLPVPAHTAAVRPAKRARGNVSCI